MGECIINRKSKKKKEREGERERETGDLRDTEKETK